MIRDDFAEALAAPTPTPGGGAAAARVALYATSLLRMVAGISLAKAAGEDLAATLRDVSSEAERLAEKCRALQHEDVEAFEGYMRALRLPRSTETEKAHRLQARQEAALAASEVPLALLETARDILLVAGRLQELKRRAAIKAESDLGGAVELAMAAFRVGGLTLASNLPELAPQQAERARSRWDRLRLEVDGLYQRLCA